MKFQKGQTPWNKGLKGIHLSPSSEFKKGNKLSPNWYKKMRGRPSHNKGKPSPIKGTTRKQIEKICLACNSIFKVRPYRSYKTYCNRVCASKRPIWNKGLEGFMAGSNHYNWQGGKTSLHFQEIHSFKYRQWRLKVMERDNFTCQDCGDNRGGNLQVDHRLPQSLFPELRYEMSNARTLCKDCHSKTYTYLNSRMRREDFNGISI